MAVSAADHFGGQRALVPNNSAQQRGLAEEHAAARRTRAVADVLAGVNRHCANEQVPDDQQAEDPAGGQPVGRSSCPGEPANMIVKSHPSSELDYRGDAWRALRIDREQHVITWRHHTRIAGDRKGIGVL